MGDLPADTPSNSLRLVVNNRKGHIAAVQNGTGPRSTMHPAADHLKAM
jgi:hypothetical protein